MTNEEIILATPEDIADHRCRFWMEMEADKLRDRCRKLEREIDKTRKGGRRVQ